MCDCLVFTSSTRFNLQCVQDDLLYKMQGTMLQDGGVQGAMYKSPKVLYMGVVVGVKGPGQGRREHAAATGGKGGRPSR